VVVVIAVVAVLVTRSGGRPDAPGHSQEQAQPHTRCLEF
jgi:hypothetical protein